jgi:hypothetical protein
MRKNCAQAATQDLNEGVRNRLAPGQTTAQRLDQ